MFCSQCGARLAFPEVRFCSSCGHELARADEPVPKLQEKVSVPKKQRSLPLWRVLVGKIFFILLCVAMVGVYASMVILAFNGTAPSGKDFSMTGMTIFWTSVFFYYLFRRLGKNGWTGVLISFCISFPALAVANHVAKVKRNTTEYMLSHNPVSIAIQKYDPAEFQRIKAEMQKLDEQPNLTREAAIAKLTPMLMTVMQKALAQTTDEAVVEFARSRLFALEEVARTNVDDCYATISGKVDAASVSRIVALSEQTGKANTEANREAMVHVIEGAIGRPRQPSNDDIRYDQLIKQVEAKLKAVGLSVDYVFLDAPGPTTKQRCAAGIQLFREALNMKEPDRSFLLRVLLT